MDRSPDPRLLPYTYALPEALIARYPPEHRDGGRLMDLRLAEPVDQHIRDLPEMMSPGDLLVVNDARVLAARLAARRATGGAVEVLLLSDQPDDDGALAAMLRPSRRLKVGEVLSVEQGGEALAGLSIQLVGRIPGGSWRVRVHPDPQTVMAAAGALPLPPYFNRNAEALDEERYQTVFASRPGAVAAPTAGLHLTQALLHRLRARGVAVAPVTLYVGAGTFRNLRPEDLDAGRLHPERFEIPQATADAVAAVRARGGRVTALGTTSTRCLESAALPGGRVRPGQGQTRLFIRPGYAFQVVDRLMTNFHLPQSSLLMLVCALGGRDRVMAAYAHAVRQGYRFYSYGDAMLVEPLEGRA